MPIAFRTAEAAYQQNRLLTPFLAARMVHQKKLVFFSRCFRVEVPRSEPTFGCQSAIRCFVLMLFNSLLSVDWMVVANSVHLEGAISFCGLPIVAVEFHFVRRSVIVSLSAPF